MIITYRAPERLSKPFQSGGRTIELRAVGEFRGAVPLVDLCTTVREVCDSNPGAKLVGFRTVEDLQISDRNSRKHGNSFPTDLLVVFEPLGGKLRDKVIFKESDGSRLIFPTGVYSGKPAALLVKGLHNLTVVPEGRDHIIQVDPSIILASPGFSRTDGWYNLDLGTDLKHGTLVPCGSPVTPDGAVSPNLRFIGLPIDSEDRYTSFVGPFLRSLGRQFIGTSIKPTDTNWLVFEFPVSQ